MAGLLLQLHKLFKDWPDTWLAAALILIAAVIVIIAFVPERKALRAVTLAYLLFP